MPDVIKIKRKPVDFERAKDPQAWRDTSARLLRSAELLWTPLDEAMSIAVKAPEERSDSEKARFGWLADHYGAFFVVAGFAVENALKARILDQHIKVHGPLSDSKAALALFPTNGKKGHDLVVLAGLAQVSLTDDTKGLLIRLTTYVRWAGRYPIPKEPGEAGFRRTTRQNDLLDVKTFLDGL